MGIIIGDLRHKITVLRLTTGTDEYGSTTEAYEPVMALRAGVKDVSGQREVDLKEKFNSKTVQFTTHFRAITEVMQIEFSGKRFRILNISEIGLREGLTITAELINV